MPKNSKKCTKQNVALKQKKLLKARLIRISMLIDDYLYKNEAISPKDANAYMEEVSNYKLIFEKDDRSLQVIEKITRCMNSIIIEQQEENAETVNIQNTSENYCPSPVYSLPDEDKTMLTQASTNLNPNMESEGNNVTNFDTVDLCDEDDDNIQRNIQVDVEIHRAMSTLSIRENEHSQDMHIVDCSQSILMDFNTNKEEEIKQTSKDSTKVNISKPKLFIPPNIQTSVVNNDSSQSLLKDFDPKVTELPKDNRTISKEAQPEINHKAPTKLNTVSNKYIISGNNRTVGENIELKNVRFSNNIETIDMTDDTEHKKRGVQRRKKATKEVNKVKRKNSTVKQSKKNRKEKTSKITAVYQEPIKIPATTSNKSTVDISVAKTNYIHTTLPLDKSNTSLNETVYQERQANNICELNKVYNSSYNESMAKIYNTNIENDLSWMENIRFVREISTDEFDPKYASLADIFWENFELPTKWNDKDFDYLV